MVSNWQEFSDVQLLEDAQSGNAEAFGELYERHAQKVFRFLYARLDNRLDAEDLTEDVFIRVWRSLPTYRDWGNPFLAYVFRIARNALIDHYRRSGASKQLMSLEDVAARDWQPVDKNHASCCNCDPRLAHRTVHRRQNGLRCAPHLVMSCIR